MDGLPPLPEESGFAPLDQTLATHPCADAAEARDVASLRAFLREHPADAHLRSQRSGHLTGSAFVVDAAFANVLLLHHAKLSRWLQPGGHGEGELDPSLIAAREVEEETGLSAADLQPLCGGRPIDVDVHLIPARGDEPAHPHLDVRYAFAARPGAAPRLSSESRAFRWVPLGDPPADADPALRRAFQKLARLHQGGGHRG